MGKYPHKLYEAGICCFVFMHYRFPFL